MLLMAEKGIRDGICKAIDRYAKENNKYMKNFDKNIKSSYLMYLDVNNQYGWINDLPQFQEKFIKNYDEDSNKGYFLDNIFFQILKYLKSLHNLHRDLPFLPERKKM